MTTSQHGPTPINRREFVQSVGTLMAVGATGLVSAESSSPANRQSKATIRVRNVDSNFEREPLNPYRFKGSAITESWQTIAMLQSESGIRKVGLCTQGVLWSDAKVFAAHSERVGNALMYAMTDRACRIGTPK